jgi:hypothetical protein
MDPSSVDNKIPWQVWALVSIFCALIGAYAVLNQKKDLPPTIQIMPENIDGRAESGGKSQQEIEKLESELREERSRREAAEKAREERERQASEQEFELREERSRREAAERVREERERQTSELRLQSESSNNFTGINGRARLDWSIGNIPYAAIIYASGKLGHADVTFFDPNFGTQVVVRQDLSLQYRQGYWFYVGSNPRLIPSGVAYPYSPDTFGLMPTSAGLWTINVLCDTQWACAAVATTPF